MSHESKPIVSDTEAHYTHLLTYFKNLIRITGIVCMVVMYLTYRNVSEIKSEMAEVKKEAKAAIESTTANANLQIVQIRERAAEIALTEAKQRVNDAFKAKSVSEMVEAAAKKQVGEQIEKQVRHEVENALYQIQYDITSLGRMANAGMQMRMGYRAGLEELLKTANSAATAYERDRARMLLDSIAGDIEREAEERVLRSQADNTTALQTLNECGRYEFDNKTVTVQDLLKVTRTHKDLYVVSLAFLALRDKTGVHFKMFDISDVERWCTNHSKASSRPGNK
jgi:hypothetical protein